MADEHRMDDEPIRVLIAPEGLKPRASNSTPDVLRTGPGVAASTLIAADLIDEAASS